MNKEIIKLVKERNDVGLIAELKQIEVLDLSGQEIMEIENDPYIPIPPILEISQLLTATSTKKKVSDNKLDFEDYRFLFCTLSLNEYPLKAIDLSGSEITDDIIEEALTFFLIRQHKITSLDLSDNSITDIGLKSLKKYIELDYLQKLDLSANKITDKGVAQLSAFISETRALQEFCISVNSKLHPVPLNEIMDALTECALGNQENRFTKFNMTSKHTSTLYNPRVNQMIEANKSRKAVLKTEYDDFEVVCSMSVDSTESVIGDSSSPESNCDNASTPSANISRKSF